MAALSTIVQFPDGMTVKELKEIIKDWPEVDDNGEPTEVWIGARDGTSNQVQSVCSLNRCDMGDGSVSASFLLDVE